MLTHASLGEKKKPKPIYCQAKVFAIYEKFGERKQRTEIAKPREAGLFLNHPKN